MHEAQIIHDAKSAGVNAPSLYYVSQPESLIVMEEIEGPRLKSLLQSPDATRRRVSAEFGSAVGRLHRGGIMHGDLTTSNVIVDRGGRQPDRLRALGRTRSRSRTTRSTSG